MFPFKDLTFASENALLKEAHSQMNVMDPPNRLVDNGAPFAAQ
jgi:hypothetical protein